MDRFLDTEEFTIFGSLIKTIGEMPITMEMNFTDIQ